jgi:hypothetical protein
MFASEPSQPSLTEPGVKYFLYESLKRCRDYRNQYKNQMINLGILLVFLLITISILIYKYKGKMTPQEKQVKENEKKHYILSKIKNYQDAKRTAHQQLITSLPQWNDEFAILRGQSDMGMIHQ